MGKGQWGDRFTATTIKDTWTKSRGRVEVGKGGGFGWGGVEGWGENADNCNRITIKNNKSAPKPFWIPIVVKGFFNAIFRGLTIFNAVIISL